MTDLAINSRDVASCTKVLKQSSVPIILGHKIIPEIICQSLAGTQIVRSNFLTF